MAATKLIAMHQNKGRTVQQCLKDRTDYAKNGEKTEDGKYISSFLGFAPADDPQVIALITIDEPVGIYYGGTIAAPVVADIYSNILPYLDITSVSETD